MGHSCSTLNLHSPLPNTFIVSLPSLEDVCHIVPTVFSICLYIVNKVASVCDDRHCGVMRRWRGAAMTKRLGYTAESEQVCMLAA